MTEPLSVWGVAGEETAREINQFLRGFTKVQIVNKEDAVMALIPVFARRYVDIKTD